MNNLEREAALTKALDITTRWGREVGMIPPFLGKLHELIAEAMLAKEAATGTAPERKALEKLYHAVSGVGFGFDVKEQKQRLADALKEAGTVLAAQPAAAPAEPPPSELEALKALRKYSESYGEYDEKSYTGVYIEQRIAALAQQVERGQ